MVGLSCGFDPSASGQLQVVPFGSTMDTATGDGDHYRNGYRYFYQLGFSHLGDHGNWNIDQLVRR